MKVVNFIGGRDANSLEADVEFRNSKKARLNMNWQNNEVKISFTVSLYSKPMFAGFLHSCW